MTSSSAAAVALPITPTIPAKFLAHLGITAEQLDAIAAQGVSLEKAVATGVIKLPAPLSPAAFPGYLRTLDLYVEVDRVPEDPYFDEEVSVEDAIKLGLLDDSCSASD